MLLYYIIVANFIDIYRNSGGNSNNLSNNFIYFHGYQAITSGSTPTTGLILESNRGYQSIRLISVGNNNSSNGYGSGSGIVQITANGGGGGVLAFISGDNGGFQWTNNSSTVGVLMTLKNNGNLLVGTASDNGVGVLQINGNTTISGNTIIGSSINDGVNKLQINGSVISTQFKLSSLNIAPISSTASGTLGEIRIDGNYIYVCTATNTWVRSILASF
jgi:hypothetical protein